MRFSVLICIICFSLLIPTTSDANQKNQIIVVLRYDDYSSLSSTELEVKIIATLKKHNVNCLFSVIPYITSGYVNDISSNSTIPLTPQKAMILKNAIEAGTLDIALHGYSHQIIRKEGGYTEFYGSDYHSQCQKIEKGKDFLEQILGTQVLTFVPPWNSYDSETVRCLEKMRFRCISASVGGDLKKGLSQLAFLPATCELPNLRAAIESARHVSWDQSVIVVLFHNYDFSSVDKKRGKLSYEEFDDLIEWLSSQEDIHVMSIRDAINVVEDLSSRRLILNHTLFRLTPPLLTKLNCYHSGLYLPLGTNLKMRTEFFMILSLFYLAIVVISAIIATSLGFIVIRRAESLTHICKYIALSIPVVCVIYILYVDLRYPGAIVIAGLIGVCIGLWSSCLILRKKGRHLK